MALRLTFLSWSIFLIYLRHPKHPVTEFYNSVMYCLKRYFVCFNFVARIFYCIFIVLWVKQKKKCWIISIFSRVYIQFQVWYSLKPFYISSFSFWDHLYRSVYCTPDLKSKVCHELQTEVFLLYAVLFHYSAWHSTHLLDHLQHWASLFKEATAVTLL